MNEAYSQAKRRRHAHQPANERGQNENEEDDFFGSQFSVPASQAASQRRYLSQRSNLQRSQVVKPGRRPPTNYYESVLFMAGLSLDEPGGVVVLKCEPIVFMHKLKSVLRTNADYPTNVDRFLAGIETTMKDRTCFLKLLECCQVVPGGAYDETMQPVRKPVQESLMKMFLLVDFLQLKLIELLFGYLMRELGTGSAVDGEIVEDSIVGFVLSQLKFIDHVQNGELVFEKVFELLAKANRNPVVFDEIIFSLEDVIDVSKHDDALARLVKLRPRPQDLITPSTVEVFTGMCLSVQTLELLRRKVVQYVADGCPLRYYPSLVKMLLKFNRTEPLENITEIVRQVRRLLDTTANGETWTATSSTADDCADQVLRSIQQAISASAQLYDAWITVIRQLPSAEDHLPIDLLLLTIATTINEVKAPRIRKLAIKKIEQQFFTDAHTDLLVSGCFHRVLQTHLDGFLQLIECCTREKNERVCEFGVAAMSALFSLDQTVIATDNRVVLSKIVGFICEMASANVTSRNDFLIGRCIGALRKLHESHPKEIERSAELLLRILDIAPELTLKQYRPLISVIYAAVIPSRRNDDDTELTAIRDNLEIIVKKQLMCDNKDTKRKGIIGLVQMVYYLSLVPAGADDAPELSSSFDSERTIGTVSDIPSVSGRNLANLVSTLFLSTNQSPDLLAICYDELASMLAQSRPRTAPAWEKTFIIWLSDTITMDFQGTFLVENDTPLPSWDATGPAGILLARKLCINDTDEEAVNTEAASIAVNVGGGVLVHGGNRHTAISYLAPIFRLMRTLHFIRYGGVLESINALLGCTLVVPEFYGVNEEEERRFSIDVYEEGSCTLLLDIYFYLSNWFRECVSAFVGQEDAGMRRKVLQRLHELVTLEHRLGRMLERMIADSEYIPPLASDFMDPPIAASKKLKFVEAQRTGRPKAGTHDKTVNLDAPLSTQTAAATAAPCTVGQFNEQSLLLRCGFALRRMDPELVRLFTVQLVPARVLELPEQRGTCLALAEYRFVLENVTVALEQSSEAEGRYQRCMVERWQEFVERTAVLQQHLQEATHRLQPASVQELLPLKSCYLWSLRLATAMLTWKRFREHRGRAELVRVLRLLVEKLTESEAPTADDLHLTELAKLLLKGLIRQDACFGDLSIAAQLYRLARAIGESVGDRTSASRSIARFTRSVLTASDIRSADSKSNHHFTTILEGLIDTIGLKALKQLIVDMRQDVSIDDKITKAKPGGKSKAAEEPSSITTVRTFASFKRPHYALMFKGLCRAFLRILQDEIRIRSGSSGGANRRLELWEAACEAAGELTNIVKRAQQAGNFGVYLRFAQIFIKLFLKSGLPALETILRSSAERASNLLSTLQTTTRYLHNVCCQTKVTKGAGSSAGALAQIPFVRESVETLVYRVKAALVANRCSAVFWMGNLKNKDMQGELIASQQPEPESDEEEEQQQEDDATHGALHDASDIADDLSDDGGDGASIAGTSSKTRSASVTKSSQSKCF
ncbi:Fanconi anemia group D2 protein homolog [Anopheles maculipalpis]|uniref:Fanconi anemia group D2 protein homolog n=1 Tax=Anopheles maculipalpis TaxID=1496333 RepID=UPI0021590F5A|nr:Fanconi anemia group D2 protein homolog [Anopheles maculipalpis]